MLLTSCSDLSLAINIHEGALETYSEFRESPRPASGPTPAPQNTMASIASAELAYQARLRRRGE